MGAIRKVGNGISGLNEWVGRIVSWTIPVMMCLIILDIFARWVLRVGFGWPGEINQEYLLCAMAMLGGGYAMRHDGHVKVDLVYDRLPIRTRAVVDIFTSVFFFAFCLVLIAYGWKIAWKDLLTGASSSGTLEGPLFLTHIMIPLGAILIVLQRMVKFGEDLITALQGTGGERGN